MGVSVWSNCCNAAARSLISSFVLLAWASLAVAQTSGETDEGSVNLQALIDSTVSAISSERLTDAIRLAEEARDVAVETRGVQHPDSLYATNLLASAYALSGRFDEAEPLFAVVLEQLERNSDRPSPDKLVAHFNLADLQVLQRRWGAAAESFEAAFATASALGAAYERDRLEALSGAARVDMTLGRWDTAQTRYGELIALAAQTPDSDEYPLMSWRRKRAEALSRGGDHAAAEAAFVQALTEVEARAGAAQPLALQIRIELAEALARADNLAVAYATYQRASELLPASGVAETRLAHHIFEGQGDVARARSRLDEAERAYTDWLDRLEATPSASNAETQRARYKLAGVLAQSGRPDEAATLYREIVTRGEDDAVTGQTVRAAARLALADLLFDQSAFAEAEPHYAATVARSQRLFGLSDPTYRYAVSQMAFIHHALGNREEALARHLQALTDSAIHDESCSADCTLQLAAYAVLLADTPNRSASSLLSGALRAVSDAGTLSSRQDVKLSIVFPDGLPRGVDSVRQALFETAQPYQAIRLSPIVTAMTAEQSLADGLAILRGQGDASPSETFVDLQGDAQSLRRLHGDLLPFLVRLKDEEVELTGIEYERIAVLQTSYARLIEGVTERFRARLANWAGEAATETMARNRLIADTAPETAFVSLNLLPDEVLIAFISADRAVVQRSPRNAALERDILNSRLAIFYEGRGFGDFNTTGRLQTLFDTLMAPISSELRSVRGQTLVIDAHGPLSYIPFAALHDGESFIAEQHPTLLSPSPRIESFGALSTGSEVTRFGNTDDPAMRSLFAGLGFQGQAFAGEALDPGTLTRVVNGAPDILQVESPLILNGLDPNRSVLTLSNGQIGLRSVLSALNDAAQEIDLISLIGAATLSGLGQDQDSDTARLGTGADLQAIHRVAMNSNVSGVAVSLWPLTASHRSTLLSTFYDGWVREGARPAEALNRAQRQVLENPETLNPYHWAGLTLVTGDE
ncbi:MAG: tetratricopeptide repeat protein [Pseudomonadota bacterium]